MTERRDDGPFEIPVERLAAGRGQRRRALVAALSIVFVVGGAIGLARLAESRATASASRAPALALASPRGSTASAGPSVATRSTGHRVEELLDVPNRPLPGAPHLMVVEQDGADLTIQDWTAGAELTAVRTVPKAVPPDDPSEYPVVAPAGATNVLLSLGGDSNSSSAATGGRARLLDRDGRVLWTADGIAAESGAIWSSDGRLVVTAGNTRRWHVVSIARNGVAKDLVVRLPGEVFLPSPTPIGSMSIPRLDPRTIPLGFSADGRWAYGGLVSPELGILIGEFRVALDGSKVERVLELGVGRADGLVPQPGTLGGRLVDPTTGRIANSRVNPDTTGGPPTLEVRNADAGFAFVVRGGAPLGSWWGADGGLYVLTADSQLYASEADLVRVGPDGTVGPPIVATGPITSAGFLGIRNGYAALVISVTREGFDAQIVLVDVADPTRISALPLPIYSTPSILSAELRP
jgi:hypothetical protein